VFEFLKAGIIPQLFKGKDPNEPIRVWVPGCATGEEAYTIAILLLEEASQHQPRRPCKCSAPTSIPARWLLLEKAATPIAIEVDVNEERLRRFFNHDVDHYRVRQDVPGKSATDNLRAH
jgi:two-component system, chemotaxis family, CheB/CheR fusion protein